MTAIGYHGGGSGALELDPLGRRGNQGLLARLLDRVFGGSDSSLMWYQLRGGSGPATSALAVGAAPETDVYSPVDGTIAGITDYVLNGRTQGKRIDIRPLTAPALIVSVTRLRPDPSLTVGSSVAAGSQPPRRRPRPLAPRASGARAVHARRRQPRHRPGLPSRCTVAA